MSLTLPDIDLSGLASDIANHSSASSESPITCPGATPIEWAALSVAVFTICAAWLVTELPTLVRHGPHHIADAVTWQCVPSHCAVTAAARTLADDIEPGERAAVYVHGPFPPPLLGTRRSWIKKRGRTEEERGEQAGAVSPQHPRRLSRLEAATRVMIDLMSIGGTAATVYAAINRAPGTSPFSPTSWMMPSLPGAVYGLWLQAASTLKLPTWPTHVISIFLMIGACMAAVVPIARLQRDREEITWAITLVGFFFITAPGLVPRRDISRVIRAARAGAGLSLLWMGFFRIGSIAYGSLSEPTPDNLSSFPFCALRNKAFGIPFIIIGVFASILSVRGVFIFYGDEFGEDCCWGIFRRADGPREDTSPVSVRIDGRWQQIPRHFLEPRMPDIPRYA